MRDLPLASGSVMRISAGSMRMFAGFARVENVETAVCPNGVPLVERMVGITAIEYCDEALSASVALKRTVFAPPRETEPGRVVFVVRLVTRIPPAAEAASIEV